MADDRAISLAKLEEGQAGVDSKYVDDKSVSEQPPLAQIELKNQPSVRFNTAHSPHEGQRKSIKRPSRRWKRFREYIMGTMPGWESKLNGMETFIGAVLRFWDSLLRGIGQVGYVNNSIAGLCVLIIALVTDTWVGICGLTGCFFTTLFAGVTKLNAERFRSGLFGFNGYLLGANMAVTILAPWDWKALIITVTLSPLVTIFQIGYTHIFASYDTPPFGAPLLTVIYLMYLCMYPSSFLRPWDRTPSLPNTRVVEYRVTAELVFEGLGASISEMFFTSSPWSAIPFIALLLLRSPWHCIGGVTGAVFGNLTLFLLGVNADNIKTGLWGWNAVLACTALFGEFLKHNWRSWIYTAYAAVSTTIIQVGMIALFQVWGIPMSNISYTIVCVLFMAARKSLPGLHENVIEQVSAHPAQGRKDSIARRRAVSRFMKL